MADEVREIRVGDLDFSKMVFEFYQIWHPQIVVRE
jgi:hypothetical protein